MYKCTTLFNIENYTALIRLRDLRRYGGLNNANVKLHDSQPRNI